MGKSTGLAKRGACAARKPCQNVAALAERGCRSAPRFPSVDQAEPTRSATVSDRVYGGDQAAALRGAEVGESRRPPSYFGKLFQISASFVQGFQRKLWRFCGIPKGYRGSKPKRSNLQIFRRAGLVSARCRRRRDPTHYPPRARGGVLRCDPVDDGGRPRPLHAELKRASGSSRSAAAIVTLPALIVSFSLGERGEGKNRGASRSDTAA